MTAENIKKAYKVLDGEPLTEEEARDLVKTKEPYTMDLYSLAHKAQRKYSPEFGLCAITNAKSGNCGENCSFCAQSRHNSTKIETYPLRGDEALLEDAREAKENGAQAFSLVTSGTGYERPTPEFAHLCEVLRRIKGEIGIDVHVSLGTLSDKAILMLKDAGVDTIHHNIESAPSFFPQICTTHSSALRIETATRIKAHGARLCCGGIIGLGETEDQRVEFAFTLRDIAPQVIPLNIHQKIDGTRAKAPTLSMREILNTVAVLRLVNPTAMIKIAAGRETSMADYQGLVFNAGANGMLIGGYLTIRGRSVDSDKRLLASIQNRER